LPQPEDLEAALGAEAAVSALPEVADSESARESQDAEAAGRRRETAPDAQGATVD